MEYGLGVDLGTTYTAAAVRVDGRLEIAQLGGQRPEIPSVVFVKGDGEMLIGDTADWRGDAEPDRLVREFKRRMGDPVPIMVAGSPYSAHQLTARLLRLVVDTVIRHQDGPPSAITVAHPANWTRYKLDFLSQAVHLAELENVGVRGVAFRSEPEAAALQYAATERVQAGETLAVYDLGGGTFDAAVLRKTATGFELRGAPEGIENLGGGDFDEVVLDHVTGTVGSAVADLDLDDEEVAAGLARLRRDCVRAKENLSFDTETTIQVALPGLHRRVRLTRSEFESRIGPPLEQTIAAMRRALRMAGVDPAELRCVLLTGGASRIPLVGQLLAAEFARPLAHDAHPEHSVAFGAALATAPRAAEAVTPAHPVSPAGAVAPTPAVGETAIGAMATGASGLGPAAARGVAKVGGPPDADEPADAGGRASAGAATSAWRRTATRAATALRSRNGRIASGTAVLVLAAGGALQQWWPGEAGVSTSPGSPSPSVSIVPVALFRAPVQGPVETPVAVDAGRVYVASGRTIQAYSRTDGKLAWKQPFTARAAITAAPYVAGSTLYVSAEDQQLHLINTADGRQLAGISTGERDPGPATVAGNALFLGTSGGLFSRYSLPDRVRQGRYQTGAGIRHPPAVGAGLAVVSSGDGNLYAFDAGADDFGEPEWSIPLRASSAPIIAGGRVFVGGEDKKLHAIDARTRRTVWTFATGAAIDSTPVVDGALVYVGGRDGMVYAIDAATGVQRWRFAGPPGESFSSVQVAGGVVYVAAGAGQARTGQLYALDAATSRQLWQHEVDGRPGPPRVADGVLYVGTTGKTLHALRVAPAGPAPAVSSVAPPQATFTPPPPTRRPQQNPDPKDPDDNPPRTSTSPTPTPGTDDSPPPSLTTSTTTEPPTDPSDPGSGG